MQNASIARSKFGAFLKPSLYLKGTSDYDLLFDAGLNPTDQVVKVYSEEI